MTHCSSHYRSKDRGPRFAVLNVSRQRMSGKTMNQGEFKMTPSKRFQLTALCSLLAIGLSSSVAPAQDLPATREVNVGVSDVYVPGGFDSEADAYVVVNGIFPNGCYRWKGAEVANVDVFHHEIKSIATVSQGMCLMVLLPFTKEVRLGKLASGEHHLKFVNGDGTHLEKTLKVE
ncbi:MAG: hypothetical protein ACXWC9_03635 [Pseudobdellovibrionaceae bacterium]